MITAEVKGVTKYYDELSETWTPENELPVKDIWDEYSNDNQKMWLNLYAYYKKSGYFSNMQSYNLALGITYMKINGI